MSQPPVLVVDELRVRFRTDAGETTAVHGVGFALDEGEVLAAVGESGSGKSATALAALGLLPRGAEVSGSIALRGTELVGMPTKQLRRVRGGEIAMIFQEPMTSLNPVFTIGWQLVESVRLHAGHNRMRAWERAVELLWMVGLPDPADRMRSYQHQLSGGQQQRVVIALALACEPKVLIADEPTTALDVTVQAEILSLLRDLRSRLGMTILVITHDMGVVADLADRVVVLRDGIIVERAEVGDLFRAPEHEYTAKLLSAVPTLDVQEGAARTGTRSVGATAADHAAETSAVDAGAHPQGAEPVLRVTDLGVSYGPHRAVHDVTLHVNRGEVLGLVGESGSGKSTVGWCVARLIRPSTGRVELLGRDITNLSARRMRPLRHRIGVVFQDPGSSLDLRRSVGDSIAEPLRLHGTTDKHARRRRVADLLDWVELSADVRERHPHELSGGQRQRVSIARALALEPDLLIADEPTSALDVSVQDTVLRIVQDLQHRLHFSCLFISHDLAVVNALAQRVAVLHDGELVECDKREQVLGRPQHEYTKQLLTAAPVLDPERQRERRITTAPPL